MRKMPHWNESLKRPEHSSVFLAVEVRHLLRRIAFTGSRPLRHRALDSGKVARRSA
jgi:hypothetical protein